jgi:membrane protease YdiL (CAAX protease family)
VTAIRIHGGDVRLGRELTVIGGSVAWIAAAEACIAFASPLVGATAYALLLVVMLTYAAVALPASEEAHSEGGRSVDCAQAIAALALVPVLRLVSLTAPVGAGSEAEQYLLVGAVMASAIGWATWGARLPATSLTPRFGAVELWIASLSVPLALGAYFAIRPASIGEGTRSTQLATAALAVALAAVVEELIFRGFVQSALARLYGPVAAPLLATVIYVVSYLGVRPSSMIVLAGVQGLLFGWLVQRTRSLVGITMCHALVNIGLFVVLPHVISSAPS